MKWITQRQNIGNIKVDTINPTKFTSSTSATPLTTSTTSMKRSFTKPSVFVHHIWPSRAAQRRVSKISLTTVKLMTTSVCATPTARPTPRWGRLLAQRRKQFWPHDNSCGTVSTEVITRSSEHESRDSHINSRDCLMPPWHVGNFLIDGQPPSEEDWWEQPNTISVTCDVGSQDDGDIDDFVSNNDLDILKSNMHHHHHRHSPIDVTVESNQVVCVPDENDDETMTTKETIAVSSSFVEIPRDGNHQHPHHNDLRLKDTTATTTTTTALSYQLEQQRLFRNYGTETWNKTRAAWRSTRFSSPEATAATSCWPMKASSASLSTTSSLGRRERNKLLRHVRQQSTVAIKEYDWPRRIRLQDAVSIYSTLWREMETKENAESA